MAYLPVFLIIIVLIVLPVQSAIRSGRKRAAIIWLWCGTLFLAFVALQPFTVVQNYSWSAQYRALKQIDVHLEAGEVDLVINAINSTFAQNTEDAFIGGLVSGSMSQLATRASDRPRE